jgi:hypothetical protein
MLRPDELRDEVLAGLNCLCRHVVRGLGDDVDGLSERAQAVSELRRPLCRNRKLLPRVERGPKRRERLRRGAGLAGHVCVGEQLLDTGDDERLLDAA